MPDHYVPMLGSPDKLGPLYWQNDQSGVLVAAVHAYFRIGSPAPDLTGDRIELVRQYCAYWINAPCWQDPSHDEELAALRAEIETVGTNAGLQVWLERAYAIEIDPF